VTQQLKRSKYNISADLIFPYSGGGNPHLVDALAYHAVTWSKDSAISTPDQQWIEPYESAVVEFLRESEVQVLGNISKRLQQVLESVSPLRFYRLEALRYMLNDSQPGNEQPDIHYLNILRDLDQQTDVVWWDRTHRAYTTSQVVRQLIGQRQLLATPKDYAAKQRRALDMYWSWVQDLPTASEDFIGEILFHQASLYRADRDSSELLAQSRKALHFAKEHLTPDRFLVVRMQFDEQTGDHELLDLLPPTVYAELSKELK
jgi:hypothetical protein